MSCAAKVAAVIPACAAQPGWTRLVQATSSRNCRLPDAIDNAMPCARAQPPAHTHRQCSAWRAREALGVEADQTPGRERARERADDAGRMKALMMKAA